MIKRYALQTFFGGRARAHPAASLGKEKSSVDRARAQRAECLKRSGSEFPTKRSTNTSTPPFIAVCQTLVERKTGLVFITRLADKTTRATITAIQSRFCSLPAAVKQTLTLDNGFENLDWQSIEARAGTRVFFAHPYHSWERGTNENTNGLIRWYFPKGTDFATIPDESLRAVEHALNTRPRKRLGWRTPLEVFNASVALQG